MGLEVAAVRVVDTVAPVVVVVVVVLVAVPVVVVAEEGGTAFLAEGLGIESSCSRPGCSEESVEPIEEQAACHTALDLLVSAS